MALHQLNKHIPHINSASVYMIIKDKADGQGQGGCQNLDNLVEFNRAILLQHSVKQAAWCQIYWQSNWAAAWNDDLFACHLSELQCSFDLRMLMMVSKGYSDMQTHTHGANCPTLRTDACS